MKRQSYLFEHCRTCYICGTKTDKMFFEREEIFATNYNFNICEGCINTYGREVIMRVVQWHLFCTVEGYFAPMPGFVVTVAGKNKEKRIAGICLDTRPGVIMVSCYSDVSTMLCCEFYLLEELTGEGVYKIREWLSQNPFF